LGTCFSLASQTPARQTPDDTALQPAVFYADSGVSIPELLPRSYAIAGHGKCNALDEVVPAKAVVDADGKLSQVKLSIHYPESVGRLALQLLESEQFKPALRNGSPVAAGIALFYELKTCLPKQDDGTATLRVQPKLDVELQQAPATQEQQKNSAPDANAHSAFAQAGVTPPSLLSSVEPEYPEYARKKKIEGICLIALIIDAKGNPQNIRLINGLDPGLDANALEAVKRYKFKPATRNGMPMAVQITVTVQYRLYK
jgi:TonB family protein